MPPVLVEALAAKAYQTGGAKSETLTVPAYAQALIVAVAQDAGGISSTMSFGGKAMTQLAVSSTASGGAPQTCLFELLDLTGRSNDNLTWTAVANQGVQATFITAGSEIVRRDAVAGFIASLVGSKTWTLNPAGYIDAVAIMNLCPHKSGGTVPGDVTPNSPATTLSGIQYGTGVHPTAFEVEKQENIDTSTTVGFTCSASAAVRYSSGLWAAIPVLIEPDLLEFEVEVPAGVAVEAIGDSYYAPPTAALEVVVLGLEITSTGPMQVALVGEDREIHRHTTGGTEGQVLTYHEGTEPDWQDGGGGTGDHGELDGLVDDDHPQYAIMVSTDDPPPAPGRPFLWYDPSDTDESLGVVGYWQTADPGTPPQDESIWFDEDETGWVPVSSAGVAFPGSPTTGQRFFRTDHGMEFFYDGTRWLTTQVFQMAWSSPEAVMPWSVTNSRFRGRLRGPHDLDCYILYWRVRTTVTTTNSGSAFWTVRLVKNSDNSNIASFTTGSDTVAASTDHTTAVNAVSTETDLYVQADKTSTPGNIHVWCGVYYRQIAT